MNIGDISIIVGLIAANAFFVGAEFGLISARRSTIELKALDGSSLAKVTLKAMEQVSLMLAGAQLGITLASLALGAVAEPIIAHFLEGPLEMFGTPEFLLHPISFAIALGFMTYLHVVFGEMIPKNIALAGPDKTAIALAPILYWFVRIFYPVVISLNWMANRSLRLFGVEPKDEVTSSFTRDEVAGFVKESHREGLLDSDEEKLLRGSLRFDKKRVESIIIPLSELTVGPSTVTPLEIERMVAEKGFSRFPLQDSKKKLIGYVHLKDILDIKKENYAKPLPRDEIRALPIVKSTDTLHEALLKMQRAGAHMAQVVNNRKRVLGVIMMEDALEELVGEIRDDTQDNQ